MLGSFHTCCPLYIFKTGYLTEFGVHPAHPKDLSASTFPVPVLDISHYAFRVCFTGAGDPNSAPRASAGSIRLTEPSL